MGLSSVYGTPVHTKTTLDPGAPAAKQWNTFLSKSQLSMTYPLLYLYSNLNEFSSKIVIYFEFCFELSLLMGEALHYTLCSLRGRRCALPRTPSRSFSLLVTISHFDPLQSLLLITFLVISLFLTFILKSLF